MMHQDSLEPAAGTLLYLIDIYSLIENIYQWKKNIEIV